MKFLPLVHASLCVFFYADYGILYEELLVRAKKTQVVLHMLYMIYVHVHTYTCKLRFQL